MDSDLNAIYLSRSLAHTPVVTSCAVCVPAPLPPPGIPVTWCPRGCDLGKVARQPPLCPQEAVPAKAGPL